MKNALTFDVEEWFHVSSFESRIKMTEWDNFESRAEDNVKVVLDILSERDIKATFFVLGHLAERKPALVKNIHRKGHEVATHGYSHKLIYTQSRNEFAEELRKSIDILQNLTGSKVYGHRAASFSVVTESLWALDVMMELGLKYDSSIVPVKALRCSLPETDNFPHVIAQKNGESLLEFPLSTSRILGRNFLTGGFYFRSLPYCLIKNSIRKINNVNKPAIVYLHPWELDPYHPVIEVPLVSRFIHYYNLKTTKHKLMRLLNDFEFNTVKEVLSIE